MSFGMGLPRKRWGQLIWDLIRILLLFFKSEMAEVQETINPLDISFSNEKGFEPSTPSQTSPPLHRHRRDVSLHVRNPSELFTIQTHRQPYHQERRPTSPHRLNTPPSRPPSVQPFDSRYTSSKKGMSSYRAESPSLFRSVMLESELRGRKQADNYRLWGQVEAQGHLKEISRLDSLINRVETHMGLYTRLYPKKRY